MSDYMLTNVPAKLAGDYRSSVFKFPWGPPGRGIVTSSGDPHFVVVDLYEALGASAITPYIRQKVDAVSSLAQIESGGCVQWLAVISEPDASKVFMRAQTDLAEPFRDKLALVARELRTKGYYVEPGASVPPPNGQTPGLSLVALTQALHQAAIEQEQLRDQQKEFGRQLEAFRSTSGARLEAVAAVAEEAKQIARGEDGFRTMSECCSRHGLTAVPKDLFESVKDKPDFKWQIEKFRREYQADIENGRRPRKDLDRHLRERLLTVYLNAEGIAWSKHLRKHDLGHYIADEKRSPGAHCARFSNAYRVEWLEEEWWPRFAHKMGTPA